MIRRDRANFTNTVMIAADCCCSALAGAAIYVKAMETSIWPSHSLQQGSDRNSRTDHYLSAVFLWHGWTLPNMNIHFITSSHQINLSSFDTWDLFHPSSIIIHIFQSVLLQLINEIKLNQRTTAILFTLFNHKWLFSSFAYSIYRIHKTKVQ